jgi:hypothetical protein
MVDEKHDKQQKNPSTILRVEYIFQLAELLISILLSVGWHFDQNIFLLLCDIVGPI